MNVFALHRDPKIAAQMMCDKHVVKMIVESCQILSAVMDVNYMKEFRGEDNNLKPSEQLGLCGYPKAHVKHPSTLWATESKGNYIWLCKHLRELNWQYHLRYNRFHKRNGDTMIYESQMQYLEFPKQRKTEFVQAITNKKWHRKDPIDAYRVYYNMEKFVFAKWKLGNIPHWYTGGPKYEITLENS